MSDVAQGNALLLERETRQVEPIGSEGVTSVDGYHQCVDHELSAVFHRYKITGTTPPDWERQVPKLGGMSAMADNRNGYIRFDKLGRSPALPRNFLGGLQRARKRVAEAPSKGRLALTIVGILRASYNS